MRYVKYFNNFVFYVNPTINNDIIAIIKPILFISKI